MLLNTTPRNTKSASFIQLLLIPLVCTMNAGLSHAKNDNHYRQEPITPIPQTVEYDEHKAGLGEQLFFDTRLSKNNKIACASCHELDSGGDETITFNHSTAANTRIINTPSIFNAQYNFRQNWDGAIKTLQQQVDETITNHHKFDNDWETVVKTLSSDEKLRQEFNAAYQQGLSRKNIIDAIVEFEKTLGTPNSRFDRYLRNESDSLSEEEIKGYKLFKELGCISCHQGVNIGGNLFQKFGVFYNYIAERGNVNKSDFGRMNTTNRQMDKFVFKVPSLRNVAVTAPYLHDGSIETIEEAIEIMGKTQLGRTLSVDEILLIKAFLITLTGEYKNKPLDIES